VGGKEGFGEGKVQTSSDLQARWEKQRRVFTKLWERIRGENAWRGGQGRRGSEKSDTALQRTVRRRTVRSWRKGPERKKRNGSEGNHSSPRKLLPEMKGRGKGTINRAPRDSGPSYLHSTGKVEHGEKENPVGCVVNLGSRWERVTRIGGETPD